MTNNKKTNGNVQEAEVLNDFLDKSGVDPDKAIVITKMVEEYTLQKIERINSVEIVKANLERIDDVILHQMKAGRHYDNLGDTNKKRLKLAGQDLLMMNFSIRPSYKTTYKELGEDHRDYESDCWLFKFVDLENSLLMGEGHGSCSTKEKKYRMRWVPVNYTPNQDYWRLIKNKEFDAARKSLPEEISNRKIDGKWVFCKQTENPNIPDVWNTCMKMSRIRAKFEAIQTLFAISEAFDFITPEDISNGNEESTNYPPDLGSMPDNSKGGSPETTERKNKFHWDYTIPDLADPDWFKNEIRNAKSGEEIDAFMKEFKPEYKFFDETIQKSIYDLAAECYRKFKQKNG